MKLVKIRKIGRFGAFANFDWARTVGKGSDGNPVVCQPLNFIFGRNYSGKTTLSKILQAFERKALPEHYENAAFELEFEGGAVRTEKQVADSPALIRVFNRDFILDNLAFLSDTRTDNGQINAFAVLGEGSANLEKQIAACKAELGREDAEKSTGLMADRYRADNAYSKNKTAFDQIGRQIEKVEKSIAQEIKSERHCNAPNYNAPKLKMDVETLRASAMPPTPQKSEEQLIRIIDEHELDPLPAPALPHLRLSEYRANAHALLRREIITRKPIEEFLNDLRRESWAREGYALHKDKPKVCAFCGQPIPDERWIALGAHFENEGERLRSALASLIRVVEDDLRAPFDFLDVKAYYTELQDEASALRIEQSSAVEAYRASLHRLVQLLKEREQAIATPCVVDLPPDVSERMSAAWAKWADLNERNNAYTREIENRRQQASEELRFSRVARRIREEGLDVLAERLSQLEKSMRDSEGMKALAEAAVEKKTEEIAQLRRKRNDESGAADLINRYLSWMGEAESLKIVAIDLEEDGVKSKVFRVLRKGLQAYNLSEGECNLIAFCYFLAKLSAPELEHEKPIIWIDDPISSLDSNHIYFIYAMIRAVIIGEKRYGQLFVSTHNLEFLRYMMRLGDWEKTSGGKTADVPVSWFYVNRSSDGAVIEKMPKYLRAYTTEFSYLFKQICHAAKAEPADASYENLVCGFANAARRFLEIYLYFRFPNDRADKSERAARMTSIFGDNVRAFMVDRVLNELSHAHATLGLGMAPLDAKEVHTVACEILASIKSQDERQYACLLKGIDMEDPLEK